MQVLVVDDDPEQVSLRCLLLEQAGLRPLSAATPAAAISITQENAPECAVLDLHLPTAEAGLQLVRRLKALNPAMKIFVLTGRASVDLSGYLDEKLIEAVFIKGGPVRLLLEQLRTLAAPNENGEQLDLGSQ